MESQNCCMVGPFDRVVLWSVNETVWTYLQSSLKICCCSRRLEVSFLQEGSRHDGGSTGEERMSSWCGIKSITVGKW